MSLILLVEDVADNRELARLLLEVAGHTVIEAHDGLAAVALAAAHRPDLILMDLSLPEMDGWEATRHILAAPATSAIPIVAVTAHAMAGDRERVMATGFAGYITKPIEVAAFAHQVAGYLPAR